VIEPMMGLTQRRKVFIKVKAAFDSAGFRILSTFGELVRDDGFELSGWSGWCKGRWERQKSPRGAGQKTFAAPPAAICDTGGTMV
jgi:hypothetical protein